jgi:hypothetical protein
MKYSVLIVILLISAVRLAAQPVPRKSIEDEVIGWMKIYHYKGAKEPLKVDDKIFSPAQLSICDSLANWIQASYIPKGGLGDVKKSVSERLGLYNQHTAARPQMYGAYSKTYLDLKYNSNHKLEPQTNSHVYWGIFANQIPGNWPVRDICSTTDYYFTMPSFESAEEGYEAAKKDFDISGHPNLKPYTTLWVKNMGFGGGMEAVLLSKDNKSPFIPITKGEYLLTLERAILRYYEAEKKKIVEREQGIQQRIAVAVKSLDEKIARLQEGLKNNREKYKNRLEETALTDAQPGLNDLENRRDLFSAGYLTDPENTAGRLLVYKVDPTIAELCEKDKPQWILVTWEYYFNNPVVKHLHESILNNFNFQYVYNFFFDPGKVTGPYKPLRSPTVKETVAGVTASEVASKNAADKNIHFFEDFSTTPVGKNPLGWKTSMGYNNSGASVTKLDGLEGNWTVMGRNHTLTATQIKKPLPQNFTLSYDILAAENFTWGAKGLSFKLAKENSGKVESFVQVKLRPGWGGRDGEVTFETQFPSPYLTTTKWLVAKGFSNDKKYNRVNVTIVKKGETLQLFTDETKIAEYEKAVPASLLFNALSFDTGGGDTENDKYYIGNIKISKD